MPFQVPDHYFIQQRKQILEALRHEWSLLPSETARREIDRISPLLGEIKRSGIAGRWNTHQSAPNTRHINTEKTETPDIILPAPVRKMSSVRWWTVAAALVAGILLTIQLITYRSLDAKSIASGNTPASTVLDSIAFSADEINAFLSENRALNPEVGGNSTATSAPEHYLASADLLLATESLALQMEVIPVHELEAYINDVSPMVD